MISQAKTTIKLSKDLVERLRKIKIIERETYESVIERILKKNKENDR